jgi:hypothetical protein
MEPVLALKTYLHHQATGDELTIFSKIQESRFDIFIQKTLSGEKEVSLARMFSKREHDWLSEGFQAVL